MSRSKWGVFCEFIASIIMIPYFIGILRQIDSRGMEDAYSFKPIRVAGNSSDIERPINNSASIDKYYNCNGHFNLSYSYKPEYKKIARRLMNTVQKRYYENNEFYIEIHEFPDFDKMKDELDNDFNNTYEQMCGDYIGGVYFTDIKTGTTKPALKYRFLLPKRNSEKWKSFSKFWLDDDPVSEQSDRNQIPSDPPYWQSGLLSLQYSIEMSFVEMNNNYNNNKSGFSFNNTNVSFLRIPINESGSAMIFTGLRYVYVLWTIVLLSIMLHIAKEIVIEKEAGIKNYMSVMGLHTMAFYISHIFIGLVKASLVMIAFTFVLCLYLQYTSTTVFLFLSVCFGFSLVSLAGLIAAIIKKAQLTQFVTSIIPIILLVITFTSSPPVSKIGMCILFSLNPIAALNFGAINIIHSETNLQHLGWLTMFDGLFYKFTMGLAITMLLFDSALFIFLTYYMDTVLPTDNTPKQHPLFFLKGCGIEYFKESSEKLDKTFEEDQIDSKIMNENMEVEHASLDEADIIVRHMSKKWERGGNLAVDNLNFRAYRGQLSVLLGHNGAGKTTTFFVLTGMINSTTGQVLICGKDMEENLSDCQKKIGYCPQNNPLFDKLTVKEHLQLYAGLKSGHINGHEGKKAIKEEIMAIVDDVGLVDKLNMEGKKLSGGQKRKLCVAIALVSNSKVILLDEPTAGMDPEARNEIGKLLERVKKDRTVLLTTHYMEEADKLGDRIGIMVNGRLMCNGSPEFLKNRFGTGYVLSVVCSGMDLSIRDNVDNLVKFNKIIARILTVIRKHSPNARVERAFRPPEFRVILPIIDKPHFANLFDELENNKKQMSIDSFGLSLNTLERVFLTVGELAEPEDQINKDLVDGAGTSAEKFARELFGVRQQQFINTWNNKIFLWMRQLFSLVYRQFLWTIRNPLRTLMPLVMALTFFLIIGFFLKPPKPILREERPLSLINAHEYMQIPMQFSIGEQKLRNKFELLTKEICSSCVLNINPNKDLHNELKAHLLEFPPMVAGVSIHENTSNAQIEIEALFNGIAPHSSPMALSFVTNALLGSDSFAIQAFIEVYDVPVDSLINMKHFFVLFQNFFVAMVMLMCFSIFAATMAVPLVEEKSAKFKHQMMLTKLHVFIYWFSVFIWNMIFYTIFCAFLIIIIRFFGWMEGKTGELCILWALFLWSYVPMNAVISFIFDNPQRAFTASLSWSSIASIIFMAANGLIEYWLQMKKLAEILNLILYIITPTYGLGSGILKILMATYSLDIFFDDSMFIQKIYMFDSGIVFWLILCVLQSRVISVKFHNLSCQLFHKKVYQRIRNQEDEIQEDPDVRNERESIDRHMNTDYALTVRGLSKYYGNFCAVRNLTFAVKHEECFGLLGVNGAGKTTTFDILTGVQFATAGGATVEGVNVNKAPAIGYCPQFDALPMELTGREVITLLANLNGFTDVKTRVDHILWCIRMEDQADKLIQHYSGGQRRRISIGITLVTRSSLIMLDEPTAGIDPRTRREIWNLLQAIRRQNVAILLTSHSMDECEELCNKIAFMNRGVIIGIGTSQHLKSRYGNSYMLTITITNPNEIVYKKLNSIVIDEFKVKPTNDLFTSTTLRWEIPKQKNISWSFLYRKAQELADSYLVDANLSPNSDQPRIEDFSLTQNSLEQVFLKLSKINETTPEPN